ncbi:hypothetical protein [Streptomyces sp. NPDC001410]
MNEKTSATAAEPRPPLTADLTGAELLRWYGLGEQRNSHQR